MTELNPKIEDIESTTDEQVDGTSQKDPRPSSNFQRAVIWIYGVAMPIICHLFTLEGPPYAPEWQSGHLKAKLAFVLCAECGWPMYPILGFALVCLAMVMIEPRNASKSWVRFGVFSGVPVTAWYLYAFAGSISEAFGLLFAGIFGVLIAVGLDWGYKALCKEHGQWTVIRTGGMLLLLIIFLLCLVSQGLFLLIPVAASLVFATPFAFFIYLAMSVQIFRAYQFDRFSIAELLGVVTWLGALLGALRATITMSIAEYSKLPLEPPEGCYIATAAAKGHPAIVGSEQLPAIRGEPVMVNQQLTTFKIAELALRAVSPAMHRVLRFLYNRIGPRVAANLGSPILASLAYLSLKPAEWLCRFLLRVALGDKALQRASTLYFDRANAAIENSMVPPTHDARR